jgi:hypothetical protein
LAVIFRQTLGGAPSKLDIFFIRNVLVRSFMIAGFSLLPPLLAMFPLSPAIIWGAPSVFAAVCQCLFLLVWWRRRRIITKLPLKLLSKGNIAFQLLASALLIVNATGRPFGPTAGPYSVGVTAFMLSAGVAYMIALRTLLEGETVRAEQAQELK